MSESHDAAGGRTDGGLIISSREHAENNMKAEVSSLSLSLAPLPLLRAHIYIIGLLFFCCTWEEIESAKNGKRGERRGASECQENSVPRNYANSSKLPGQSVSSKVETQRIGEEEEETTTGKNGKWNTKEGRPE